MKLYKESKGKNLRICGKKLQNANCYNMGIRMLKKASGCLKDVSGCYEEASRCVHLPAPEMTNRTLEKLIKLNSNRTIRIKHGKNKSQLIMKHHKD